MKRQLQKRPIQKRSFLLFEVLLSLGLLLACLFPLIKTHVGIAKAELDQVRQLQKEQRAQKELTDIKMKLFQQKYSWQQLMRQEIQEDGFILKKFRHSSKHSGEVGLVLAITLPCGEQHLIYVEKARSHSH